MKYLRFTYVDTVTGVPVTEAPALNGPVFPDVDGLEFSWARESRYPVPAPEFFGICPDDAMVMMPGVIDVLTKADFDAALAGETAARREILLRSINARRDQLETQGFPHAGLWFQSDERSVARINSAALTAATAVMTGIEASFHDWLAADNTPLAVDAQGVLALQASLTAHAAALHSHARTLKAAIESAATLAELAAIGMGSGWPEVLA